MRLLDEADARGPVRQRQLRRGSLLLLTTNHDQGGAENALARRTSVASRTHWISFGDLRHRRRNEIGGASVSFMRAFRPPCQRTGAPLGIANGRDAGTCRGGGPLGGLLYSVWCATRRLHSVEVVLDLRCIRNDCSLARAWFPSATALGNPMISSASQRPLRSYAGKEALALFWKPVAP